MPSNFASSCGRVSLELRSGKTLPYITIGDAAACPYHALSHDRWVCHVRSVHSLPKLARWQGSWELLQRVSRPLVGCAKEHQHAWFRDIACISSGCPIWWFRTPCIPIPIARAACWHLCAAKAQRKAGNCQPGCLSAECRWKTFLVAFAGRILYLPLGHLCYRWGTGMQQPKQQAPQSWSAMARRQQQARDGCNLGKITKQSEASGLQLARPSWPRAWALDLTVSVSVSLFFHLSLSCTHTYSPPFSLSIYNIYIYIHSFLFVLQLQWLHRSISTSSVGRPLPPPSLHQISVRIFSSDFWSPKPKSVSNKGNAQYVQSPGAMFNKKCLKREMLNMLNLFNPEV